MKLPRICLLGKDKRNRIVAWAIVSTISQAKHNIAEFVADNLTVTIAAMPHAKEALACNQ